MLEDAVAVTKVAIAVVVGKEGLFFPVPEGNTVYRFLCLHAVGPYILHG